MNEENLQVKPPQSSEDSAEVSEAKSKNQRLAEMASSEAVRERFWSKVKKGSADECWEWLGSFFKGREYGQFSFRKGSATFSVAASRAAWIFAKGEIADDSLCVLHKCDNPPCCNPSHLFLGTHADNAADRNKKNRQAKGITFRRSSLTEHDVLEIRRRHALARSLKTRNLLAAEFCVSKSMIEKIVYRKNWKHL